MHQRTETPKKMRLTAGAMGRALAQAPSRPIRRRKRSLWVAARAEARRTKTSSGRDRRGAKRRTAHRTRSGESWWRTAKTKRTIKDEFKRHRCMTHVYFCAELSIGTPWHHITIVSSSPVQAHLSVPARLWRGRHVLAARFPAAAPRAIHPAPAGSEAIQSGAKLRPSSLGRTRTFDLARKTSMRWASLPSGMALNSFSPLAPLRK